MQDKWFATLNSSVEAEIERITQQLANRVKELNERYAEPLPQITQNVEALGLKVAEHLKAMGLDEARIAEAVRISWNYNTKVDFSALIDYVNFMSD